MARNQARPRSNPTSGLIRSPSVRARCWIPPVKRGATHTTRNGILFQSLTFGPNGTLFGIGNFTTSPAVSEDHLYAINHLTAEANVIAGPFQTGSCTSLSIDTDGELWIVCDGVLFYGGPVLDLEDTGLTEVGGSDLKAIAHSNGVLYGVRTTRCSGCLTDWHLVTLDPETGDTENTAQLPVNEATIFANMSADQDGVLWVLTESGFPISPSITVINELFRIDAPETGIATIVRDLNDRRGLAVVPARGRSIPTLGPFSSLALALVLGLCALFVLKHGSIGT